MVESAGALNLVKMHSAGNDYVYLDTVGGPGLPADIDLSRLAVELSDRHFGVGGDGLILIYRAPSGRLGMRMFNPDGSEGEMCGNGMRCLASYCWRQGYVASPRFEVETLAGIIVPEVTPPDDPLATDLFVTVDMGPPREIRPLEVALGDDVYRGTFVSMGNPHFVTVVPDIGAIDLETIGPRLERHPAFPNRANIEFVQVLAPDRLRMRVWERWAGLTLACGTGAAASLVTTSRAGFTGGRATVVVDGGELGVEWVAGGPVFVSGLAVEVFRTRYSRALPRR